MYYTGLNAPTNAFLTMLRDLTLISLTKSNGYEEASTAFSTKLQNHGWLIPERAW